MEKSLTNIVGTSDDTQAEVYPPNINEIDDDSQHEKATPLPLLCKKGKSYLRARLDWE